MSEAKRNNKPTDRLTKLCNRMIEVFESGKNAEDKCIIFIKNEKKKQGGIVLDGYDSDADAIADLFLHIQGIFEANGWGLEVRNKETLERLI